MNDPIDVPVSPADIADYAAHGHRRFLRRGWLALLVCAVLSAAVFAGVIAARRALTAAVARDSGVAATPPTTTVQPSGRDGSTTPVTTSGTGPESTSESVPPDIGGPGGGPGDGQEGPVSEGGGQLSAPGPAAPAVPVLLGVQWQDAADPRIAVIGFRPGEAGGPVESYEVVSTSGWSSSVAAAATPAGVAFQSQDPEPIAGGAYAVRAVGPGGASDFSDRIRLPDPLPPAAPTLEVKWDAEARDMVLIWSVPDGGGRIDTFLIEVNGTQVKRVSGDAHLVRVSAQQLSSLADGSGKFSFTVIAANPFTRTASNTEVRSIPT